MRALLAPVLLCALLGACLSPAASVVLALIPDGTFSTLLANMQGVDTPNQQRLAELAQKEDWPGIAAFAQKNIAADPSNADWWLVAGYAYSKTRQFESANRCFSEAVRLAPDEIDSWNMLGESYRVMGQTEKAIRTLNHALQVRQDSPLTYFVLGQSYRDLDAQKKAAGYYEQAVEREPEFAQGWYELGVAYWKLGRHAEYRHVIETLRPLSPAAAKSLASLQNAG